MYPILARTLFAVARGGAQAVTSLALRGAAVSLSALMPPPRAPALALAGFPGVLWPSADADMGTADADADNLGENSGTAPAWAEALWRMAVPKRKPSYSVKRKRQMNPAQQNEKELLHAYPCPKCDRGLIKLRHHLCPCDQEKLNCKAVVKVKLGVRRRSSSSGVDDVAAAAAPAPAS